MIEVLACGPLVTIQDRGRPGWLSQGLARGGAADLSALDEAAALLGHPAGAVLETPGSPLTLRFETPTVIALTGAPMQALADDRPLSWNASHPIPSGTLVSLRPSGAGVYSYLSVYGGLQTPEFLGSRSAHLIANLGRAVAAGDRLPVASAPKEPVSMRLTVSPARFDGGSIRLVATPQTRLFDPAELERFVATPFQRDPRGNRQGVRLGMDGPGFATEGQLSLLSDFILPGDIQMTGDGVPYILGPECQTTGGYPRIGTIVAADLPRALQAPPGALLRFCFVSQDDIQSTAPPEVTPLVRDPAEVRDLLSLQLISGVISARPHGE